MMSTETIAAIENLNKVIADFKAEHKQELSELAKKGTVDALITEKVDRINDAISKAEEKAEKAQKDADLAIKSAEMAEKIAKRRNDVAQTGGMSEKNAETHKIFLKYLRGGDGVLDNNEKNTLMEHTKAMGSFVGSEGGYAVVPEIDKAIIEIVRETSPIRQYAEVLTIGTDRLTEPYEGSDFESGWVGEAETRDETDTGTMNEIAWDVQEQYAQPAISQRLLDDAYFDIEAYVTKKIASLLARTENTSFVSGDGIKKPRGFLTYTSGTSFNQIEQVASGTSGVITADGLINLVESMKAEYQAGSVIMMKRSTVKSVRKLVDGNGNYLWGMGLNGGTSPDLLGYTLVRADDMPAIAASSLSVVFANFREAYRIVDRMGTRVLRDPYTKKGYMRYYTTKRVGGGVRNFDAIKIQVLST